MAKKVAGAKGKGRAKSKSKSKAKDGEAAGSDVAAYDVFEAEEAGMRGSFDVDGKASYDYELPADGDFEDEEIDSDEVRPENEQSTEHRKYNRRKEL